jgi:transposase-like protein
MAKTQNYSAETREKAVRLVREHAGDYASEYAAITAVAGRLGMTAETLRKWIRQAEVDAGKAPGVSTEEARRTAPAHGAVGHQDGPVTYPEPG